jgi:hypothetical protein
VSISFPGTGAALGQPVTVKLTHRINFLSADSASKASWLGVTLRGQATMRVEGTPSYSAVGACP